MSDSTAETTPPAALFNDTLSSDALPVVTGEPQRSRHVRLSEWLAWLAACLLAAWLTMLFRTRLPGVTGFCPMSGVSMIALWWLGRRGWPVVVLGVLLTAFGLATPAAALPVVVLTDVGSAALSAWWLLFVTRGRNPLEHVRDTALWLAICVAAAPLASAILGALALWLTAADQHSNLAELCLVRWLSSAVGVLLIAPSSWAWWPWRQFQRLPHRKTEALIFSCAVVVVGTWTLLHDSVGHGLPIPGIAFWFPLLAWSVSRYGRRRFTLLFLVTGLVWLFSAKLSSAGPPGFTDSLLSRPLWMALSESGLVQATALLMGVWLTERRHADRTLSTAEVRYRILFDNSPDAVFVVAGGEESLRQFNDRLSELLGYSHQQLMRMCRTDFELGIPTLSMRNSVVSVYSPRTSEFAAQYRRADGTIINVDVTYSVIDFFGEAAYLMIARDVTVRRLAEQLVRESEAKFRTLAETIPALVAIQRHDRALFVNPATAQLSGYSVAELLRMDLLSLVHPDFQTEVRHHIESCLRGQRASWRREVSLVTKSGNARWIDLTVAPISLEGQSAWLASAVDTTERRQTEAELRKLNAQLFHAGRLRMLGELAAGIAHRVKHPISNVGNLAQSLINDLDRSQPSLPEELRETLVMILEEAEEADHTISEMIGFARRHEMDRRWIDLAPLISDAARIARFDQRWTDVSVQLEIDEPRPNAYADRAEITQVLIDLFRNGLEAMEETPITDRRLNVELRSHRAGWLRLSISDCGCGVLAERRPKLFRAFETSKPEGLGLGLSLCKTIIESHGGKLWYEPATPKGSIFHFLLPSQERVFESTKPPAPPLEA